MCGIFAYILTILNQNQNHILRLTDSYIKHKLYPNAMKIKHRGPDSTHELLDKDKNAYYMCFHRLAVNGHEKTSEQPFDFVLNNKRIILNKE